jgi:hypothetical protein
MFNSDGTKFYMAGINSGGKIFQYSLSTAYDISTASYDSVNFSFASQDPYPTAATFNNNGTKLFMLGQDNNNVYEYSLSSAYNISTLSYTTSFSVSSEAIDGQGLAFNADGTKMYYSKDGGSAAVYSYSLSSAFDISTASYDNTNYNWSGTTTDGSSLQFSNDDSKFYLVSSGADAVYQFAVGTEITSSPVTFTGLTNGTSYTFNVWAINPFGWSSPSDASGSVSPVAKTAVFAGGGTFGNRLTLDYINIATTGNAQDWGDFAATRTNVGSASSTTRGLFAAGEYGGSNSNVIEYINFSAQGTVSDFGDLTYTADRAEGVSNSTYGIFVYGTSLNVVTMATTGNATSFGSLTTQRNDASSCSSPVYGYFSGNNGGTDNIEYITISTSGSGTSFGNLTAGSNAGAGCSSETRGVLALGFSSGTYTNIIDYITLTTSGSGSDFGDLTTTNGYFAGTSSSVRGVFAGGYNGSMVNIISYVTIATTGNATDFGDLTSARDSLGAVSNDHGGLQ